MRSTSIVRVIIYGFLRELQIFLISYEDLIFLREKIHFFWLIFCLYGSYERDSCPSIIRLLSFLRSLILKDNFLLICHRKYI